MSYYFFWDFRFTFAKQSVDADRVDMFVKLNKFSK
jgi:hypothetical protein